MKSLRLFILLLSTGIVLPLSSVFGQEQSVRAKTREVIVFIRGAQIKMECDAQLPAGQSSLRITGLPVDVDPNSIQLKGEGPITILGVNFEINYLDSVKETKEKDALVAKLEEILRKLEDVKTNTEVLQSREAFLTANQNIGGKDTPMNPEHYRLLYDQYSKNMEQVKRDILEQKRRQKDLDEQRQKLQNQLNGYNVKKTRPVGEIVVSMLSRTTAPAAFEFSFMTGNAGWEPLYDIRVDNIKDPVKLVYKANVWQKSGMDWKNVNLRLSNATPLSTGVMPVLNPCYLAFQQEYYLREIAVSKKEKGIRMPSANRDDMPQMEVQENAGYIPLQVTQSDNQTSIEFAIAIPYTIPSESKPIAIEMQQFNIPADYKYEGVPKLSKEAFLVASIKGWEEYGLLDGDANLYFENTFIGKTRINIREISDTMHLSMGTDKGVVISRTRQKDFSQRQFLGNKRSETRQWEIGIKNNKKQEVKIALTDQVPVATDESIEVSVDEISGGTLNKPDGKVKWDLVLKPGESRKLTLKYTVSFPKSKKLIIE